MSNGFLHWLDELPWGLVAVACLSLGLAPFSPPHIVEKLGMLADWTLTRPIDWFDLVFHGAPWCLLAAKTGRAISRRPE